MKSNQVKNLDFIHMWDIKQKAITEQTKKKLINTDNRMVFARGEGGLGRTKGVNRFKYMVMEVDQTLGGSTQTKYADIL